jgi:pimeloyl-ACP methyl ester carboxylesterase
MRAAVLSIGLALGLMSAPVAAAQTPLWQTMRDPAPLPAPETSGRQRIGDVDLHYAIYGKGRPIVLLHDSLGNSGHWGNQVATLAVDHKVIVVDSRGQGRSSRGDKPYSYAVMADDTYGLLRELKLKDAIVVGWGDGAIIGLELAMKRPRLVRKLIMFGGNYNLSGLNPDTGKTATFAAYIQKSVAQYNAISPAPDFDRLFSDLRLMWSREPNYTPEQLGKVKPPVTVLIAEHEETVKVEHARQLVNLMPNAELVFLPGLSHYAPWQDPRRFNDTLKLVLE